MKKKMTVIIIAIFIAIIISSCNPLAKASPEELLAAYFSDAAAANPANWSNMYNYLDPSMTSYGSLRDGNLFSNIYEGGGSSLLTYSIVSSSGDTYIVSVPYPTSLSIDETFVFVNLGSDIFPDYRITSFTDNASSPSVTYN